MRSHEPCAGPRSVVPVLLVSVMPPPLSNVISDLNVGGTLAGGFTRVTVTVQLPSTLLPADSSVLSRTCVLLLSRPTTPAAVAVAVSATTSASTASSIAGGEFRSTRFVSADIETPFIPGLDERLNSRLRLSARGAARRPSVDCDDIDPRSRLAFDRDGRQGGQPLCLSSAESEKGDEADPDSSRAGCQQVPVEAVRRRLPPSPIRPCPLIVPVAGWGLAGIG